MWSDFVSLKNSEEVQIFLTNGTTLFLKTNDHGVVKITGKQILHNLTKFYLHIKIDNFESYWNFDIKPDETKSVALDEVRAVSIGLIDERDTIDS
jgi:hypothetical protein